MPAWQREQVTKSSEEGDATIPPPRALWRLGQARPGLAQPRRSSVPRTRRLSTSEIKGRG